MTLAGNIPLAPSDVPGAELEHLRAEISAQAQVLDMHALVNSYRSAGLDVANDPFDPALTRHIASALRAGTPYSAIRIGDGEISFLAYGEDSKTPVLDRVALVQTVMSFPNRFRLTAEWAGYLKERMHASVAEADAVGVLGIWRAEETDLQTHVQMLVERLAANPRGASGYWRGIRMMQQLGIGGAFDGKLLVPAHFYFGLALNVAELIAAAQRTICLTNRPEAVADLRRRFPESLIDGIALQAEFEPIDQLPDGPDFLAKVESSLPQDLTGQLALIGAGAWAEFYCTVVKQRGGAAVDIGSAFDLMQGIVSRPIHNRVLRKRNLTLRDFSGYGGAMD